MSREVQVRFCERRGVRFPPPTLHLLGFTGPKAEAEVIKQRLAGFLRDELKLELSYHKTLITHACTGAAGFLGYEITVQHNDNKATRRRRTVNGQVALRVPLDVIKAKCAPYLHRGKPAKQKALTNGDDYTIVAAFGAIYRGIVQYYLLAGNVHRLHRLRWVMETSMLKTLAGKHRSATVIDRQPIRVDYPHTELVHRLLAGICEICQQTGEIQVHHVRKLADLGIPGPLQPQWAKAMTNRRRKTLVVCASCHDHIHTGQPAQPLTQ